MNDTYTINSRTLAAALTHAGKKDIRFYLNGVCVDLESGRIIATDGHRMFIAFGPMEKGAGQRILPRSLVETVCKAAGKRGQDVTLAFAGTGSEATCTAVLADGRQFGETLIDGKFPDWQRVLPRTMSGIPGQYNAEYLYDAAAALALHGACNDVVGARVAYNGHDSACVVYAPHCAENMAYCIIMPVRADGEVIGKDLAAFIGLEG